MLLRIAMLALCASASMAQIDELSFDVIDLSSVTTAVEDAAVPNWRLPLRAAYESNDRGEPMFPGGEDSPVSVTAEDVMSLLRDAAGRDVWEREGTRMWLLESGDRLAVVHTEDVIDRIRTRVATLARSVRRVVELEVLFVEGSAAALASLVSKGVVPASQFDVIRSGAPGDLRLVGAARRETVSGQRVRIRDGELVNVIGDASVEVAQTATIGDPLVQRLSLGVDLVVRPTMMIDGRINVRAQFDATGGLEIEKFDTRAPAVGIVELPTVSVRKVTASGAVRPGEGIVIGAVEGGRGDAVFALVRVFGDVAPSTAFQEDATTKGYPVSYLVQPHLTMPALQLGWANGSMPMFEAFDGESNVFNGEASFMFQDEIIDLVRKVVTSESWGDGESRIYTSGGWMWVTASRAQHQGIVKILDRLTERRGAFATLECYVVDVATKTLQELQSNGSEGWLRQVLRSGSTFRRHTLVTTAELGGRVDWVSGREFAFVADFDPEIAQGAQVSEPRVETGFDGVYLRIAPRRIVGTSEFILIHQLELARVAGPMRVSESDPSLAAGRVQLPRMILSSSSGETRATPGTYALVAEVPRTDEPDISTLVIVRLRQ